MSLTQMIRRLVAEDSEYDTTLILCEAIEALEARLECVEAALAGEGPNS